MEALTDSSNTVGLHGIARNSVIGYFGVVFVLVVNFFIKILLSRVLSVGELGLFFAGQAVIGLILVAAQLSLPESVVRFVGMFAVQEMDKANAYIANALWLSGLSTVFFALGVSLCAGWIADTLRNPALAQVLLLLAVSIPLTTLADVLAAAGRGVGQLWIKVVLGDVTRPLWVVMALGLLFLLGVSSLSVVIWVYLTGSLVSSVLTVIWFKSNIHLQGSISKASIVELLRYGLPLLGTALLAGPLVNSALPLLITRLSSVQAVAYYNLAISLSLLINVPIAVVEQAALPVWSAQSQTGSIFELRAAYAFVARWSFLASSIVFALLWFNAGTILTFLYGPAYITAAPSLQAIAAAMLFGVIVGPNAGMLRAFADTHWLFVCSVVTGIVSLAVGMFLIPTWGLMGGVLAFVTAVVLTNSLFGVLLFVKHRIHPVDGIYLKTLVVSFVSFFLVGFAQPYLSKGIYGVLMIGALYTIILVCMILIARAYTDQDLQVVSKTYQWLLRFLEKKRGTDAID